MAATLIARTAIVDDDGTLTTGTIWNNAWKTELYAQIDALFKRTTAGDLALEVENTDVTATSDTGFIARVGSGAAGDPYFQVTNGTQAWTWGEDNSDADKFVLSRGAVLGTTNVFTVTTGGVFSFTGTAYVNDDANANMTLGFTINQGANDDEAFALKSSDVAHGITDRAETDTYFAIRKASDTLGGLTMRCFTEGTAAYLCEAFATTENTTKTTGGFGYITWDTFLKLGTGTANPGADANLFVIRAGSTARFIFDAEGSAHADVEWIAFDQHHDTALLSALNTLATRSRDVVRDSFGCFLEYHREDLLKTGVVTQFHTERGRPRAVVNWTKLSMLHTGALVQQGAQMRALELRIAALEAA